MKRLAYRLGVAIAATACLSGLAACSSCSGMGCVQNVTVNLAKPLADAGKYEVDFAADGTKMSCTLTVPSSAPPDCTNERAFVEQEHGRIVWLSVDGDMKKLAVTMLRDGEPIADQTFSVAYQDVELNGAGCGTCPAASETLTAN